ncbi:hypothetical protein [Marinobacter sp. LV10MA510-1]|uniref:hypothetical protein n=1 Tax=Marinobacter sp. LV10MA510-1 TaxID=1415567 RepID=UPI00117CF645|nr:hypothetical protein [Marinobacter sp. LV10MA510-1]
MTLELPQGVYGRRASLLMGVPGAKLKPRALVRSGVYGLHFTARLEQAAAAVAWMLNNTDISSVGARRQG